MHFSKSLVHVGAKEGRLAVLMKTETKDGWQRFVQVIINKEGLTAKLFDTHCKCNNISESEEINKTATNFFFFFFFAP